MNVLNWLKKEIKEEWSDIASPRMKRYMILMGISVLLAGIGTLFQVNILVLFAIFAILWIGRDLRYGYSELKGMEHVMAVIIYLATIGLILGFIKLIK